MNRLLELTLLFDFYGNLLTDKQREIFEAYHLNDLSMQELGENYGVSRQAVNSILKRTEKLLRGYEDALGLLQRHMDTLRLMESFRETAAESGLGGDTLRMMDEWIEALKNV